MATATRGRRTRATKPAEPVEELEDVEELGDEDEDVEELELDEPEELEEEPAPRRRRGTKAAPAKAAAKKAPAKRTAKPAPVEDDDEDEDTGPQYDTNWLAEFVNETCGTDYDSRALRMLLRRLAKNGTISREVGTDRSRYTFPKGANDRTVKAVVAAVKKGEVEDAKSEGISRAQASKGTKKTTVKAAPAKAIRGNRTRRTRAVEVDDEEDED